MRKEWTTADVLRNARHDWLNKIQLIKGNLDLKKYDRVKEIIDEIVIEAQEEAKLSNLKIPRFTALILTANWQTFAFDVEFEVFNETDAKSVDDLLLADWTDSFFTSLHTSLESFNDNHLSVTIETEENGTRFFFDFRGLIRDKETLQQFLENPPFSEMTVMINEFSQQELAIEVFMPAL